jgi:hypothetical protein
VQRVRRCREEEFDESDFCPVSEHDPEEMLAELRRRVEDVRSETVRSLLIRVLGDEKLVPALKVTRGRCMFSMQYPPATPNAHVPREYLIMLCHDCGSTIEERRKDRAPVLARFCVKCRSERRRRHNLKYAWLPQHDA